MATYLSAVNSVLKRLREREVTSVNNTTYSRLVGELVNDVKREVEDAWNWTHLKSTIQVTTIPGSFRYELNGSGQRFRLINDYLGRPAVFNDTEDVYLQKSPSTRWMSRQLNHDDVTENQPDWFEFNGFTSDGDVVVDLYPIPDKAYSINFDLIIPQEDFNTNGTDDDTVIQCPVQPIVLGSWSRAIYERGEDNGYLSDLAYRDYQTALADAISHDTNNTSDEPNWYVI
jgi:hypothetical protein